jgi:hypothetical protein
MGNEFVVISRTPQSVIVNCLEVEAPLALVRVTVKVSVLAPEPTGPLMTPVAELRLRPFGKTPVLIDQVYGVVPPVPCSVWL